MTALPAPNHDALRLREFIDQLSACSTIEERDLVLAEVIGEATEILTARRGFLRHWLLALDGINKRFVGQEQSVL
jgi:hypothetical protein